jgi:type IV pilus assembly protein PilB
MVPVLDLSASDFNELQARPVVKLVHFVLVLALADRATEVSLGPTDDEYRVTYRVGGVDYEMIPPPRQLGFAVSQVFKVVAELDICKSRIEQSGPLRVLAGSGSAEMVVSIRPTPRGEAVHVAIESNTTTQAEVRELLGSWVSRKVEEGRQKALWRKVWPFGRGA